jgi:hypothetical protein
MSTNREAALEEVIKTAWDNLRSAYQIAERSGNDTNWVAFRNVTRKTICDIALSLGLEPEMPNMVVTPKTFRLLYGDDVTQKS